MKDIDFEKLKQDLRKAFELQHQSNKRVAFMLGVILMYILVDILILIFSIKW